MVQFIKAEREGGEKLSSSSHGLKQKAIFPTIAAADGSLGRSSEDQQDSAAAEVSPGPLWTIKRRLEILGLHRIITYISLPTSFSSERVGFNEKKRHGFLKVMEKIDD